MARIFTNNKNILKFLDTMLEHRAVCYPHLGEIKSISLDKMEWVEFLNMFEADIDECRTVIDKFPENNTQAMYKGVLVFFNGNEDDFNEDGYFYQLDNYRDEIERHNREVARATANLVADMPGAYDEPQGIPTPPRGRNGGTQTGRYLNAYTINTARDAQPGEIYQAIAENPRPTLNQGFVDAARAAGIQGF